MNTPGERDDLVEAVASAWRSRDASGRVHSHPFWHDLDATGRIEAFEAAVLERAMEAAVDPKGLSATGWTVIQRITRS